MRIRQAIGVRLFAVSLLLLVCFVFTETGTATDSAYVVMVPVVGDGSYPEWKNFTVAAGTTDQISSVLIQWDEQNYHFSDAYMIPPGWGPQVGIPPLPGTNKSAVKFESTDEAWDITPTQNGTFKLEFDSGPGEGDYYFVVTTVDRNTRYTQDFHPQQHVIPEFSLFFVPLLMIATLLVAMVYKRERPIRFWEI
jgi:hypothetical protein